VEHEYCTRNQITTDKTLKIVPNHNPFSTIPASGPGQSTYDPYDWSSDDEYFTSAQMTECTSGCSDCAERLLTATTLYFNSPTEVSKNWGQIDPNNNDYYTDPTEFSREFWIPNVTDW
jgi:hypothetical protein